MKKMKVLINGLGRIGRAIVRINLEKNIFDLVAINDINPDNKNMAYLLRDNMRKKYVPGFYLSKRHSFL